MLLDTPLARVTDAFNVSATNMAGTGYIYEDDTIVAGVPQTASLIHATIGSENKLLKATLVVDQYNYFIIEDAIASVLRNVSGVANFTLEIKPFGGVWIEYAPISVQNGTFDLSFRTPAIIQPNHDVRIVADTADNNLQVSAILTGFNMRIV